LVVLFTATTQRAQRMRNDPSHRGIRRGGAGSRATQGVKRR
jgi:hypothetical protein